MCGSPIALPASMPRVVHLTALVTTIGWLVAGATLHDALMIAVSVLIITCPCALALAVPAVQVVAAGGLFRRKILLNGADAIERLAEIDTIVFDKTGTLTLPILAWPTGRRSIQTCISSPRGWRSRATTRWPRPWRTEPRKPDLSRMPSKKRARAFGRGSTAWRRGSAA